MGSKELYEFYKKKHICTYCGQNDAIRGHTLCWDCQEKQYAANKKYNDSHRKENAERLRKLRAYRKENGLCIQCGKPSGKFSYCEKHRAIKRLKTEKRRREKGIMSKSMGADGYFCGICLKPVEKKGMKLFNRCYQLNYEKCMKMIANRDNSLHWWRTLNDASYREYIAKQDGKKK
jgi:hypothetical protein